MTATGPNPAEAWRMQCDRMFSLQASRQADRQADRQTRIQTDKQTDIQTMARNRLNSPRASSSRGNHSDLVSVLRK